MSTPKTRSSQKTAMDNAFFTARSTMRQCLVITSCPPFLATTMLMILGLVLLLEEVILVPGGLNIPEPVKREIPEVDSPNVIYSKRISSFWKVEDFIVQKGPMRIPRRNTSFKSKNYKDSGFVLDQNVSFPLEQTNSKTGKGDNWEEESNQMAAVKSSTMDNTQNAKLGDSEINLKGGAVLKYRSSKTHHNALPVADTDDKGQTSQQTTASNAIQRKKTDKDQASHHITPSNGQRKEPDSEQQIILSNDRPKKSDKELTSRQIPSSNDLSKKPEKVLDPPRGSQGQRPARLRGKGLGDDNSYSVPSSKHRARLLDRVVDQFRLGKDEPRDSFINLHRYGYVLDSDACNTGNPKFAILIHSKFNNFIKRAKIRNTFAKN
ncbi:hypothetical protein EGW08_002650, partial [Elysia chlorotica]